MTGEATSTAEAVTRLEATYLEMLAAVGDRASDLGDRAIAAHWPFQGTRQSGLVIAGQALDGWDAPDATARFHATDMNTAEGRQAALTGIEAWATHRPEPISEVTRWGHRTGSPFWTVSRKLLTTLDPNSRDPWFSRYVWWNVFPLSWDLPPDGPGPLLKAVQRPFVSRLFWQAMDLVRARQVVLVSGRSWWWEVRELLGLEDLVPARLPLIATGSTHGRSVVASYHPKGARLQGIGDEALVGAIADALSAERQAVVADEQRRFERGPL